MASTEDGFNSFRFSTENLPPQLRLPMWHDVLSPVSRRILSPLSDRPFNVEMMVYTLARAENRANTHAGVSVVRMALTMGGTARRTRALLSTATTTSSCISTRQVDASFHNSAGK